MKKPVEWRFLSDGRIAMLSDEMVFQRIGHEGFARLVGAFYQNVKSDPILGPLYPAHDFAGAEQRLREFLIQRFGGPTTYSERRGHPRLRMRHAPFAVDVAARDRWVELMEKAMVDVELPDDIVPVLRHYFLDAATHMINR